MLPFKLVADDSDGLISVCEFTLPGWSFGPVLPPPRLRRRRLFVVIGVVEFQLGADRLVANAGDFAWVPRGTAHAFASASAEPVHVVGFATPGGIEHLFAAQFEYLSALDGPPDSAVMDEIGLRHGAPTLGPPITATNAPALP
jgi:Cupin domain